MQWEYLTYKYKPGGWMGGKVDLQELDQQLNEFGAKGWELANVFDTNFGQGVTREVVVIFKRPKNQP